MLTEPGLPTRVGPKRTPSKTSVPYPKMPEMSVLPHGKHTLLPKPHLSPAPSPSQARLGKPGKQKATSAAPGATQTCSLSRCLFVRVSPYPGTPSIPGSSEVYKVNTSVAGAKPTVRDNQKYHSSISQGILLPAADREPRWLRPLSRPSYSFHCTLGLKPLTKPQPTGNAVPGRKHILLGKGCNPQRNARGEEYSESRLGQRPSTEQPVGGCLPPAPFIFATVSQSL